MPEDLTAAEQAALNVLYGAYGDQCDPHGDTRDEIEPVARAVVAAVRPEIFEEVAQRLLQHAQDAKDHDATEAAVYTFMVAANNVREWAAARQSGEGQR